jgi:Helicase HerA, central domain
MKFPILKGRASLVVHAADPILLGCAASTKRWRREPVYITPEALTDHSLVVGKEGTGKTTLLKLLAKAAMEREMSLVVIDADGDLAPALLGEVPADRVKEATYFDLSNTKQLVGLNLLDPATALFPSLIVDTIVRASEMLWKGHWVALEGDFLHIAVNALLQANERLAENNEELFTLLDLVPLFENPTFRHQVVSEYLDDDDMLWWTQCYEGLSEEKRRNITEPLIAKIRLLAENVVLRNILGQPKSAINFRELLSERRITLINLAQLAIPHETREWLGTILTRLLAGALSEERDISETRARGQLLVVLDGFQPVTLIDELACLPDFQRLGTGIVFSETSLARLEQIKPTLASSLMTNVTNFLAFRTTLQDSEVVTPELGAGLGITDLVDLPFHSCYARIQQGDRTAPGIRVKTKMPSLVRSAEIREQILSQSSSHTQPADKLPQTRHEFEDE